jgi:hypothetical protein
MDLWSVVLSSSPWWVFRRGRYRDLDDDPLSDRCRRETFAVSGLWRQAENICSQRVFRILTLSKLARPRLRGAEPSQKMFSLRSTPPVRPGDARSLRPCLHRRCIRTRTARLMSPGPVMAHIDQPQRLSACRLLGASPIIAERPRNRRE